MRRAFIALGIIIFLLYCWASVVYENAVDIPDYKTVTVDLMNGMSKAEWDKNQQAQLTWLMDLENRKYQLPVDSKDGSPEKPLTSDDFSRFIAKAPAGQPALVQLRDTSAIYELVGRKYLLRDTIRNPQDPDGDPLYYGGVPVEKKMLDDLRGKGFHHITVTGHAAPVNFQIGTSLMIVVIFFTLVAALMPILWNPFIAMLEKRRKELDMGAEAERQNQVEKFSFEEEKRRRNDELARNLQAKRLDAERDTAKQAAAIIKEARDKERSEKVEGLRQLGATAASTREEMEKRIPELAKEVADALTPGKGGARWDGLKDSNKS